MLSDTPLDDPSDLVSRKAPSGREWGGPSTLLHAHCDRTKLFDAVSRIQYPFCVAPVDFVLPLSHFGIAVFLFLLSISLTDYARKNIFFVGILGYHSL